MFFENSIEKEAYIQQLSDEEYKSLCENVKTISQKLKSGYYFRTAMEAALNKLQSKSME